MYQTSTNTTPKYSQEMHYNYMGNSGFGDLYCSPLLCYRFVTTALTAQIPAETLSQSHRLCFMLLHYHYVSTSLTMQIPTETLSQTHRVCFMLLCYNHAKTTTFSAQSFTGKERDSETGFSYFGARYYDSDLMTGWLSVDPMADKYPSLSPYAYCAWNPIKLVDPDGRDTINIKYNSTDGKWNFDKSGKYTHKERMKGEHIGVFLSATNKQIKFSFVDPINDPASIDASQIKRIEIISDKQIANDYLERSNIETEKQ